jgi:hypothetical protein
MTFTFSSSTGIKLCSKQIQYTVFRIRIAALRLRRLLSIRQCMRESGSPPFEIKELAAVTKSPWLSRYELKT